MSTRAASACSRLAALRRRVDAVDRRLVRLLAARQRLVAALGPLKTGLRDIRRESAILKLVSREAGRSRLDQVFTRRVYRALLGASRAFLKRSARTA